MEAGLSRKIVLENGLEFYGAPFGAAVDSMGEIVFNTSMAGYQEIASDPSYAGQMIVMTYPLIGNYGVTDEDFESGRPVFEGFIVREYNRIPSNFRYTRTLDEILAENGIPGISGVDTRRLTRIIRDEGTQKVLMTDAGTPYDACMERLRGWRAPTDQVARVSCKKPWHHRTANPCLSVVAVDCGIKLSIVRKLGERRCNVTVVPYDVTPEEVLALGPDGLFLSNGPGDPKDVPQAADLVRALRGRLPMFGICLGHQVICLACGGDTYKMKFGHRGGNHPVQDLATGKIEMTSQNHGYAVRAESLGGTGLAVTHRNLLDGTVEGAACPGDRIFSVQYHPESAPGPQDSAYLFDRFVEMMKEGGRNA